MNLPMLIKLAGCRKDRPLTEVASMVKNTVSATFPLRVRYSLVP